ncbi:hypothetical protein B566_EDAN001763 [Ephemera danica]|nr:hypothetical protein B566_EDAN001763 [Ephemera danica]
MMRFSKMGVKRILNCDIDIRWINLIMCWTIVVSALCVNADQSLKNTTSLSNTSPLHCSHVRLYLQNERGYGEIPREPISGQALKLCGVPRVGDEGVADTCCTPRMEAALAARARQDFDNNVNNAISGKLAAVIRTKATKFDEYFGNLLSTSKIEFDEMFKKTYGVIYEQNSQVFTDLFIELEKYYSRGQVRLDRAMESFFEILYQKIFIVLNSQYHFDANYLKCVGNHMKELKPFGDVPHKLSLQVKRSFIATRTFSQALIAAADVATKMQGPNLKACPSFCANVMRGYLKCVGNHMKELKPFGDVPHKLSLQVKRSFIATRTFSQALIAAADVATKMQGPNLKACPSFCANVMRGCLAYHSELNTEWNSFVDAFVQVASRLLGPFNIEVVVEPINIKISEAIMNFQENGHEVSQKVFSGCGRPRLGKRSNPATELNFETLKFGQKGRGRGGTMVDATDLEKLISESTNPKNENNCWNGQQKSKYTQPLVTGAGIAAQASNPEVKVNPLESSRVNSRLNEQIYTMRLMANKLRNAYNGKDVDWESPEDDDEDTTLESGSGSGSGDFATEAPDRGRGKVHEDRGPVDQEDSEGSGGDHYDDYHDGHSPPPHSHPIPGHQPPSGNNKDLTSHPSPGTSAAPPALRAPLSRLDVTRAVAAYLFPIVVVWFQGIFNEW